MNFLQPLSAKAQQAKRIYTRSALKYNVSILFKIDYRTSFDKYYLNITIYLNQMPTKWVHGQRVFP